MLAPHLPPSRDLLADKGYDANWFREVLIKRGISPCIPPKRNRRQQIAYDKALYRQRHKVENMFGKLKDWRRSATRYDKKPENFLAVLHLASMRIWLRNYEPTSSFEFVSCVSGFHPLIDDRQQDESEKCRRDQSSDNDRCERTLCFGPHTG